MVYVLSGVFLLGAVAAGLARVTADRGLVTHRSDGYDVPDEVRRDPEKRRQANLLVGRWSAVVVGMCVVPAAGLVFLAATGRGETVGTPAAAGLAVWGVLVVACALYPFEKIKHL